MLVKICGLRDNYTEVLALKPDFAGLIFYPKSPRYVPTDAPDILKQPLHGTKKVGVFVNEDYDTIKRTAGEFNLDAIQLHGSEPPLLCDTLRKDFVVIKAFSIAIQDDLERTKGYEGTADYFLFDTKTPGYGGSGTKFDWDILKTNDIETPFLLSGGISPDDIATIKDLSINNLAGVDLNSKFETAPTLKDIDKLKNALQKLS